eukprot:RCo030716
MATALRPAFPFVLLMLLAAVGLPVGAAPVSEEECFELCGQACLGGKLMVCPSSLCMDKADVSKASCVCQDDCAMEMPCTSHGCGCTVGCKPIDLWVATTKPCTCDAFATCEDYALFSVNVGRCKCCAWWVWVSLGGALAALVLGMLKVSQLCLRTSPYRNF